MHRCAPEAFRASMRTVSRTFEETAASFDLLFLGGPVDSLVRLPRGLASARSPARLLCGLEAAGTAVPARTAASCGTLAGVSSAISAHRQLKRPGLDPATLRIRKGGGNNDAPWSDTVLHSVVVRDSRKGGIRHDAMPRGA